MREAVAKLHNNKESQYLNNFDRLYNLEIIIIKYEISDLIVFLKIHINRYFNKALIVQL